MDGPSVSTRPRITALGAVVAAVAREAMVVEDSAAVSTRWEVLRCKESNMEAPLNPPMACRQTTCILHTDVAATHLSRPDMPRFPLPKVTSRPEAVKTMRDMYANARNQDGPLPRTDTEILLSRVSTLSNHPTRAVMVDTRRQCRRFRLQGKKGS